MTKTLNDSKKLTRAKVWLLTPNPPNLEVWFKTPEIVRIVKVKNNN